MEVVNVFGDDSRVLYWKIMRSGVECIVNNCFNLV